MLIAPFYMNSGTDPNCLISNKQHDIQGLRGFHVIVTVHEAMQADLDTSDLTARQTRRQGMTDVACWEYRRFEARVARLEMERQGYALQNP